MWQCVSECCEQRVACVCRCCGRRRRHRHCFSSLFPNIVLHICVSLSPSLTALTTFISLSFYLLRVNCLWFSTWNRFVIIVQTAFHLVLRLKERKRERRRKSNVYATYFLTNDINIYTMWPHSAALFLFRFFLSVYFSSFLRFSILIHSSCRFSIHFVFFFFYFHEQHECFITLFARKVRFWAKIILIFLLILHTFNYRLRLSSGFL